MPMPPKYYWLLRSYENISVGVCGNRRNIVWFSLLFLLYAIFLKIIYNDLLHMRVWDHSTIVGFKSNCIPAFWLRRFTPLIGLCFKWDLWDCIKKFKRALSEILFHIKCFIKKILCWIFCFWKMLCSTNICQWIINYLHGICPHRGGVPEN